MSKAQFVYVTYIAATPEQVWDALSDPELTKLYWSDHRNVSDWKTGSTWRHEEYDNAAEVDIIGTVLESDRPRRLVISWARPNEVENPAKVSRVTFDIVRKADAVRLTVTHDDLESDSTMLVGITSGWPVVLAGLKTLLETGKQLASSDQLMA